MAIKSALITIMEKAARKAAGLPPIADEPDDDGDAPAEPAQPA